MPNPYLKYDRYTVLEENSRRDCVGSETLVTPTRDTGVVSIDCVVAGKLDSACRTASPCLLTVTQQGLGPTAPSREAQNWSRRRAPSMRDEGLTAVSSFCVCVAPRQVPKQASIPHHENDQTFFSRQLWNILVPVTVTTADFGLCGVSFGCISVLDYI